MAGSKFFVSYVTDDISNFLYSPNLKKKKLKAFKKTKSITYEDLKKNSTKKVWHKAGKKNLFPHKISVGRRNHLGATLTLQCSLEAAHVLNKINELYFISGKSSIRLILPIF